MGQVQGARASVRGRGDEGFTLVEAIVALMVLGIIFSALATAAGGPPHSLRSVAWVMP